MTVPASAFQPFQPFLMERWQSLYEHEVDFNLADSAVRCAPLDFLLDPDDLAELGRLELFYPPVNGSEQLRQRIAATYTPAPGDDEVLVTVGAAEANALVCQTLLERGDRVTVIEPGYRQVRGLAENLGCAVDVVQLRYEDGWELGHWVEGVERYFARYTLDGFRAALEAGGFRVLDTLREPTDRRVWLRFVAEGD